jgi:hypothetical protein
MAGVHLFQWVIMFAAATWLTARWLLTRPEQRWRHIAAGIASTLLWIPVAYTADNVAVASGGTVVQFGSESMGGVATFMVVVSIAGLIIGLLLWVEAGVDSASNELPGSMRRGRGGD